MAYGSEKNFYIRADLADIWKEFSGLVEKAVFDELGRAVVDLRWVIGKGTHPAAHNSGECDLAQARRAQKETVRELECEEALQILEANNYFNPHLLVKNEFKRRLRSRFFRTLFARASVYEVNTIGTPEESQRVIRDIVRDRVKQIGWNAMEAELSRFSSASSPLFLSLAHPLLSRRDSKPSSAPLRSATWAEVGEY